jgi:hypothetical protein
MFHCFSNRVHNPHLFIVEMLYVLSVYKGIFWVHFIHCDHLFRNGESKVLIISILKEFFLLFLYLYFETRSVSMGNTLVIVQY